MHSIKDALGDRMKGYEYIPRIYLMRRTPAIIRIDGKAFHTFTRGFARPFDKVFMETMKKTMKYLCENIQGCVLGYTQSDEITLVVTDYATIETEAWFGYNVQKMTSIAASMATLAFNKYFAEGIKDFISTKANSFEDVWDNVDMSKIYEKSLAKGAMFDARVFSLPKEEVVNCLIWRQQDAIRNSILSVSQHYFSNSEMHGVKCNELQNLLIEKKNVNWWDDFTTSEKMGSCCIKEPVEIEKDGATITRMKWKIDEDIPIFTKNKEYVESRL